MPSTWNSSLNGSCEVQDGFLKHLIPYSYAVICCVGLLSNIFTIFVFFRRGQADTSMAVYMRNLVAADFLLVMGLPLKVYYHGTEGPYYICKVAGIFFYINMYASILFLSLISLDRYLKIIKPVWVFRIQKVCWSQMISCAIWAILIGITMLFFLSNDQTPPCNKICFHFHMKGHSGGAINLAVVAFFFIIFLLFLCFYGKISLRLSSMSLGKDKRRLISKTFLIPAIFTLCFFPYHVVRILYVLAQMDVIEELEKKQLLHMLNELTLLLSALNSFLDPIIYYFLSRTYRKAILCAIRGQFKNMYDVRRRISINHSNIEI